MRTSICAVNNNPLRIPRSGLLLYRFASPSLPTVVTVSLETPVAFIAPSPNLLLGTTSGCGRIKSHHKGWSEIVDETEQSQFMTDNLENDTLLDPSQDAQGQR